MEKTNEIVLFETEDSSITLSVPVEQETVWLTQEQMSELFETARSSIAYHIGNIFRKKNWMRVLLSKISTEVKIKHLDHQNTII